MSSEPEDKPTAKVKAGYIPYAGLTEEQREVADSEEPLDRMAAARQGYGLDKLVNEPNGFVRYEVARQGFGLDKLVDDDEWPVRLEVAQQGFGLDKLVDDPDRRVRLEVARQGYGLDKLVDDPDWNVRRAVAWKGYGLDKLVDDPSWMVRCEVAWKGYGLDKLVDDIDSEVSREARKAALQISMGSEMNLSSEEDHPQEQPRFAAYDKEVTSETVKPGMVTVTCDKGLTSIDEAAWNKMCTDMRNVALAENGKAGGAEGIGTPGQWAARGEAARAALHEAKAAREGAGAKAASKSPAAAKANAEQAAAARNGQSMRTERSNPTR